MRRTLLLAIPLLITVTLSSRPEAHSAAAERPALLLPQDRSDAAVKDATISGKVIDSKGLPVAAAHVYARGFNWGGPVPGAITGADGSYSFKSQPPGKGIVSAYKEDAGFPDAEMALYGHWAYPSVAQIDATQRADIHVNLQFSEPDAMIEWTVLSKADQSPLSQATYRIEWTDDRNIFNSASVPSDGILRFVLPKHPVLIHIGAPGYKDWLSADNGAFGAALLLKPGSADRRFILLEPE